EIEVDAIGESLAGRLVEPALELAHDRCGGLARVVAARVGRGVADEQEIDVGGEVELAAAELAEREQRGRLPLARRERERAPQDAVGEVGEGAELVLERALAVECGDAQQAAVLARRSAGQSAVAQTGSGSDTGSRARSSAHSGSRRRQRARKGLSP